MIVSKTGAATPITHAARQPMAFITPAAIALC